jgi:hypothetical protein
MKIQGVIKKEMFSGYSLYYQHQTLNTLEINDVGVGFGIFYALSRRRQAKTAANE